MSWIACASSANKRTIYAAILCSIGMHALLCIAVVQFNQNHAQNNSSSLKNTKQLMNVLLLTTASQPPERYTAQSQKNKPQPHLTPNTFQDIQQSKIVNTDLNNSDSDLSVKNNNDAYAEAPLVKQTNLTYAVAEMAEKSVQTEQPTSSPQPSQHARPDYAYNPQPSYPRLLREQGVEGVVWLRVWVDSDGRPTEIKLAKASGYRLFDEAALRAVQKWSFIPAKNGSQQIGSWVEFPVRFTLTS